MKRISRFTFAYYLGPFIMALAILVFIFALRFLAMYVEELLGKNIDGGIFLRLFMYASLRMAVMALPLAILSAALITFGNMGEHYELAALKSCGIGLLRLMQPLIAFASMISLFSFWLTFEVVPHSNREIIGMLYDASRTKSSFAIRPGVFYRDIDQYAIRVTDTHPESNMLYEVMIYDFSQSIDFPTITLADSAQTKLLNQGSLLQMTLFHGSRHEEIDSEAKKPNPNLHGRLYFDSLYVRFDLSEFAFARSDSRFRHRSIYPTTQLVTAIDSMQQRLDEISRNIQSNINTYVRLDSMSLTAGTRVDSFKQKQLLDYAPKDDRKLVVAQALEDARSIKTQLDFSTSNYLRESQQIREFQHEYYNRIMMSLSCLIFMIMGVSLGAIIRKGGLGAPSVASVGFFALFYGLNSQGWKMAKYGWSEPWVGAFLPLLVFTPVALYISYQAAKDAPLFDESSWQMWRESLGQFFVRSKGTNRPDLDQ